MSNWPLTGVLLTGGQSNRFGYDKAYLKIGGQTLLEYQLTKLTSLFAEVLISVKDYTKYPFIQNTRLLSGNHIGNKIRVVADIIDTQGSLVGIYSALSCASYSYLFILACDMPLVDRAIIQKLCENRENYDVIIPQTPLGFEPLCAIYSKQCLEPIKQLIKKGDFKIINFFNQVKVKIIPFSKEDEKYFLNINTPADYELMTKEITSKLSKI